MSNRETSRTYLGIHIGDTPMRAVSCDNKTAWVDLNDDVTLFFKTRESIDRLITELEKAKPWLAANTTAATAGTSGTTTSPETPAPDAEASP